MSMGGRGVYVLFRHLLFLLSDFSTIKKKEKKKRKKIHVLFIVNLVSKKQLACHDVVKMQI